MITHWDDATAWLLVAWAGGYLVYHAVQSLRRRTGSGGGCGSGCVHCPVKQEQADATPAKSRGTLVTLSVPDHLRRSWTNRSPL